MFINREPHKPYIRKENEAERKAKLMMFYWGIWSPFVFFIFFSNILKDHPKSMGVNIFNLILNITMVSTSYLNYRKVKKNKNKNKDKKSNDAPMKTEAPLGV